MRSPFHRRARLPIALGAAAFVSALFLGASPPLQDARVQQETAKIVAEILENYHIAKPKIDDAFSKVWCKNYIEAFDPQKLYFEKADVERFRKYETELDDMIRKGDISFARLVFDTYVKRSDERLKLVLDLIDNAAFDFEADEYLADDAKKLDYPADGAEAAERWRKLIKYEFLLARINKEDVEETRRKLRVRYKDRNRNIKQFDNDDLLETYLSAMTTAADPHSRYLSAKTYEDMLNQDLHLQLEGIGARLRSEDGYAVVEEIVPGGPAEKDGRIQPEDKIVGIELPDGQIVDFVEKKLNDVVRYIRGPRGTNAKLLVIPATKKERVVYEITRDKIELKDAHAQSQILTETGRDGNPVKIGVITLPSFYGDTLAVLRRDPNAVSATLDTRKILNDFKREGVQVVVMDLRGNPGGLLPEAETLSGLFIDTGPVVQVKNAEGVFPREDDDPGVAWDGPLVVLISKTSASASEIFAGVIADYGRGLILGDNSTFGKGTVQQLFPINEALRIRNAPDLGAIKLTIQQFYRANGASTQIRGVEPHIALPSLMNESDIGEGKIENALPFDKVRALPHDQFNRVSSDLVERLREASKARRDANPEFVKLAANVEKLVAQKKQDQIPLNEAKYRKTYLTKDDLNAKDREEEEEGESRRRKTSRTWEKNYYNDEIVQIVLDYLKMGDQLLAGPLRAARR